MYSDAFHHCLGDNSSSLLVSAILIPETPALGNDYIAYGERATDQRLTDTS